MKNNTSSKEEPFYRLFFFRLYNVALVLFLFAFNNLLHVAAEDFFGIKPRTLFHGFGLYAFNTAALVVLGMFTVVALLHERNLVRKTPSLFIYVRLFAVRFRYVLLALIAVILMIDLYMVLLGEASAFHMMLNTGVSLFTILCGFGLTQYARKTQNSFLTKKSFLTTLTGTTVICGLGVFLNFFYAPPALVRLVKNDIDNLNFYYGANFEVERFYRTKKYLPQTFSEITANKKSRGCHGQFCETPPASFAYTKKDDKTCEVCITLKTTQRQRRRHAFFESSTAKKGKNCKTISVAYID